MTEAQQKVKLITVDPGHFHAALVQKTMYPEVDPIVHVYAEKGNDLQLHLDRIKGYNTRANQPTKWNQLVYEGKDFFQKMINERKGNVVVLAGNNKLKTSYILNAVQNGFHVFADKPMVINNEGFEQLKKAFEISKQKKLQLYDIMTERYEITTMLQRELSMDPSVFGSLEKGSPDNPSVTKESVHHFYKYVSGSVLTRPAWFFDVTQEGEGIVTTHLVDPIQWECFPEKIIDYKKNIKILDAKSWNTLMTKDEFKLVTKEKEIPSYLQSNINNDGSLQVLCNGAFTYTINGVHAKVSVIWNYKAPDGTGDTHYSLMRGTKSSLIIRQGKEENFKPTLYVEGPTDQVFEETLLASIQKINQKFPGVSLKKNSKGWEIIIPDLYKESHETHFARVTEKYLEYLRNNNMPSWEVPNMIAKYYTTTAARALANKGK
ncbi:MAG: Gfo/Idh/MocA family oxidoreductase [Chitinophagaceae bacterium]|nr:Gfo/Idh/MocA family oxidoreductase [Chitinophagaceae bacterium]